MTTTIRRRWPVRPDLFEADPVDTTADLWSRFYGLPTTEWLAGFEDGLVHGDAIGYQRAHDEWHAGAEVSAAIAQQIARMGPYDELEERRGRPERAAAARALWAERGIAL